MNKAKKILSELGALVILTVLVAAVFALLFGLARVAVSFASGLQ